MLEIEGEEFALGRFDLQRQRPIVEAGASGKAARREFRPRGFGVDRRHREQEIEARGDLVDAAVGTHDRVDEGFPAKGAMRR
ncbi:hypothetical protein D9M72_491270 [compost metagenome]